MRKIFNSAAAALCFSGTPIPDGDMLYILGGSTCDSSSSLDMIQAYDMTSPDQPSELLSQKLCQGTMDVAAYIGNDKVFAQSTSPPPVHNM